MNPSVPSETSGESNTSDMPTVKPAAAPAHTGSSNTAATAAESTVNKTSHQKQVCGFLEPQSKYINGGINAQTLE